MSVCHTLHTHGHQVSSSKRDWKRFCFFFRADARFSICSQLLVKLCSAACGHFRTSFLYSARAGTLPSKLFIQTLDMSQSLKAICPVLLSNNTQFLIQTNVESMLLSGSHYVTSSHVRFGVGRSWTGIFMHATFFTEEVWTQGLSALSSSSCFFSSMTAIFFSHLVVIGHETIA